MEAEEILAELRIIKKQPPVQSPPLSNALKAAWSASRPCIYLNMNIDCVEVEADKFSVFLAQLAALLLKQKFIAVRLRLRGTSWVIKQYQQLSEQLSAVLPASTRIYLE